LASGSWHFRAEAIELPAGFIAETLATNLNAATAFVPVPDGRILIAAQTGELLVWKDGGLLDRPALTLPVTDYWERGLIGITLAPDFPRTPHLFVLYVAGHPFVRHVLSRFIIQGDIADPASEVVLLEGDDQARLGGVQPGGHQGGPLRFGPDGKLFVSMGEQTAGEPAQRLDTLQGKILRVNADGSIPPDNPFFTKAGGKYRAIYAYGVRNAFGLAVQPETRRMFFTDVGGSAFEEVNELTAGANYGWPLAEGHSTNRNFGSPLYAYPPVIGQSVCGGTFYPRDPVETLKRSIVEPGLASTLQQFNTSTFPARWRGKFFFVDFMKHWLKALDPEAPTNVVTFARGLNGPVAVELAPDGSLLVLNRGTIWRDPKKFVTNSGSLVRIRYSGDSLQQRPPALPAPGSSVIAAGGLPTQFDAMPRKLTREAWEGWKRTRHGERGNWIPALEWNHGVTEEAAFTLPVGRKMQIEADGRLRFPAGTVFIRDFLVFQHPGLYPPMQPMETRVVVLTSDSTAFGCSYRWTSFKEAELVEDGEQALRSTTTPNGASCEIHWWHPAPEPYLSLPVTTPSYRIPQFAAELNVRQGISRSTLLTHLVRDGFFDSGPGAENVSAIPEIGLWVDASASPETRVRSYLHGNCAICHQPGGAARGLFDARFTTPLAQAGLINGALAAGDLGIPGAKIVDPGDPSRSILYQRLKRTDFFRMPPVQYHNEPSPILPVLEEWIRSLKP
jgi:glucose/arabinose dehydrogenase